MRIMICDSRSDTAGEAELVTSLGGLGHDVELSPDGASFLESAIAHRPDLVVYALHPEIDGDLAVLRLLRRVRPDVGLVILANDTSLFTRAAVQPLRPVYYAVAPAEPSELIEAVQAGLRRHGRHG